MGKKGQPLTFEHRAAIARSKREFWAAKTQTEWDAQAAILHQGRAKKRIEALPPQQLVGPDEVGRWLLSGWTVHVTQPVPAKVVLNQPAVSK